MISIPLDKPLFCFCCLANVKDWKRASKFLPRIKTRYHGMLKPFLEVRGYTTEILSLEIPNLEKVGWVIHLFLRCLTFSLKLKLCLKFKAFDFVPDILASIVQEVKKCSDLEGIFDEIMCMRYTNSVVEEVIGLGMEIAYLASGNTKTPTNIVTKIYKTIAQIHPM